jgi:two-component system chemotaxis response regulator CheY
MDTILIVDDSPTIRRMVRASLGALPGATFTEAASGLEGIEALAVAPVHMMVLDLNMPDMHGLDVLRFVRSHDHYKDVPVIVLTTRGDRAITRGTLSIRVQWPRPCPWRRLGARLISDDACRRGCC